VATNGRPRYVEIAEHLRAVVAEGAAGDRLPSDAELCDRFAVSRMTARQAVATLEAEGLLYRRRGQGTFVAARPVPRRLGSPLSFTENLRRRGLVVTSRLLAAGWLDPDPEDVVALGLAPGERAVVVERLRLADCEPMAIERAVLSPSLAPVLDTDLGVGSLHAAMEALGRLPTRADACVSARLADAHERRLLEQHGASGVLLCERRVISDQHGVPLEHTEIRYVAERYVFEAVVTREEQG